MSAPVFSVGSLVNVRGREWVVLPNSEPDLLLVRPLGGTEADATGIFLPLEGDAVSPARFDPPTAAQAGDSIAARLLRDAVRLNLRAGAGPFRSLGRIAVEPRPYQIVPLMMALDLDPVRLLIADDVGIGKTIEAGLIARELLDRGEIERFAVVCPPHLCEQWQRELEEKFHLDAVVVRPGTVARLERGLRHGESLFEVNKFVIVSIDFIKSDRYQHEFLNHCPELVIVDEAHMAASSGEGSGGQHQRHSLVQAIALQPDRHLILTTATPHSGIESAFRSLLVFLDPAFADLPIEDTIDANHPLRVQLSRHLIQRRRRDIEDYLNDRTVFPNRVSREEPYRLSRDAYAFLEKVLAYATELVRSSEHQSRHRQRVCWWAALALMRCVSSSPKAAADTLRRRAAGLESNGDSPLSVTDLDNLGERAVLDLDTSDAADQDDVAPGADTILDSSPSANERRRLLALAREAEALADGQDRKLDKLVAVLDELQRDGFSPIVYCRYISTAEYIAEQLQKRLRGATVAAVTGNLPAEERALRVAALGEHPKRVLIATDCLSEGINLQEHFDAVVHYDLSWNPTRLEQREGRVDRFGQKRPEVRAVTIFGEDNRVDGAIMRVLLRKAESIRKSLGVSVPVPADSAKVMDAIFESLFLRSASPQQLELQLGQNERLLEVERQWELNAERESKSRTIFAQGSIRSELVRQELDESHRALGDAADVERFVRDTLARLNAPLGNKNGHPLLDPGALPRQIRDRIPFERPVTVGFTLPVADQVVHLARTGPVVEALATYLTDTALDPHLTAIAARSGAIVTDAVRLRTTLLLLRVRIHLQATRRDQTHELLAEEIVVAAYEGRGDQVAWLEPAEAEALLDTVPTADMSREVRLQRIEEALTDLPNRQDQLNILAQQRATEVLQAHRRVRDAANQKGRYQASAVLPPDVLGLYVLMPRPNR